MPIPIVNLRFIGKSLSSNYGICHDLELEKKKKKKKTQGKIYFLKIDRRGNSGGGEWGGCRLFMLTGVRRGCERGRCCRGGPCAGGEEAGQCHGGKGGRGHREECFHLGKGAVINRQTYTISHGI